MQLMSQNTDNVKMQFAQRIRDGSCVICGNKQPIEDLEIQNIQMPTKEQKGGGPPHLPSPADLHQLIGYFLLFCGQIVFHVELCKLSDNGRAQRRG